MCELVEDFSIVGFETLAVEDKRSMLRLTRVIDKAGGFVYAPPTAGAGAVQGDVGKAPKDVRDVHLPRVGDPELAAYEPGSLVSPSFSTLHHTLLTSPFLTGSNDARPSARRRRDSRRALRHGRRRHPRLGRGSRRAGALGGPPRRVGRVGAAAGQERT